MKTSIIFTSYDLTQTMRQITMKSLESIFKYTDDEDYEIIWIDTIPKNATKNLYLNPAYMELFGFDKKPNRRRIIQTEDPGQYATYNIGAKEAKGEYLCFYQNDVFVPEGWLKDLEWYFENMPEVQAVFPDQWPENREFVKRSYLLSYGDPEAKTGSRDAGILFIRRSVFDVIGGWNDKVKVHFGEKDIYGKISTFVVTCKPMIIHLEHAAGWERSIHEWEKYSEDTTVSAMITQGLKV